MAVVQRLDQLRAVCDIAKPVSREPAGLLARHDFTHAFAFAPQPGAIG